MGFGVKNFAGSYTFPSEAVAAFIGFLGPTWNLSEKVVFFFPFAILSFLAPWLFARDLLRSSRWAALSALIFASNTYLLIVSTGGQLLVAMAEVLAPLVLWAFIRALRRLSLANALLCGLFFGIQAVYEVRIAYLTGLMCVLYLVVLVLHQPNRRLVVHRATLAFVPAAVLLGTQLYWLLPLLTYRGDRGLPIASAPWLAFMQITHGITGVHPFWTGGTPTIFRTVALNPVFFLFPLLGFGVLLKRRLQPETLWLCLATLAAAFLIKQTNPPFGGVYDWLFVHFPGWSAFREASKLFFIVALSYAVLVPMTLRELGSLRLGSRLSRIGALRRLPSAAFLAATVAVVAICVNNLVPALTGQIGFTTQPRQVPSSFATLATMLEADRGSGTVVWLGGASVDNSNGGTGHRFPIASSTHPLLELSGYDYDVLSRFCQSTVAPFCYVQPELFPYLMQRLGAAYVVAPAGNNVGALPAGLTYPTLLTRVTFVLGQPSFIGSGPEALALWQISGDARPVTVSPVIALVDGSVKTIAGALPALQALETPAIFRFDQPPAVRSSLPGPSIEILPGSVGSYDVLSADRYALMAHSQQARIPVVEGQHRFQLQRLWSANVLGGWSLYGPVDFEPGRHQLSTTAAIDLGPVVAWSSLTADALTSSGVRLLPSVSSQPEHVVVDGVPDGGHWVELRRTYDTGWTLGSASTNLVGDGIFNLYWVSSPSPTASFSFSTGPWETLGITAALALTLVVIVLWLFQRLRPGGRTALGTAREGRPAKLLSEVASQTAWIGLGLLAAAAIFQCLGWWGVSLPAGVEPYGTAEFYVAISMLVLFLSAISRLAAGVGRDA